MEFNVRINLKIIESDVLEFLITDAEKSRIIETAVRIWGDMCDVTNGYAINAYNNAWEKAYPNDGYKQELYDDLYNILAESVCRSIAVKYPVKIGYWKYYVYLVGGSEAIQFMKDAGTDGIHEGFVNVTLKRVGGK